MCVQKAFGTQKPMNLPSRRQRVRRPIGERAFSGLGVVAEMQEGGASSEYDDWPTISYLRALDSEELWLCDVV